MAHYLMLARTLALEAVGDAACCPDHVRFTAYHSKHVHGVTGTGAVYVVSAERFCARLMRISDSTLPAAI